MGFNKRVQAYPMVVLLLPLVAAILLFVTPPDRYSFAKKKPNAVQEHLYGRLAAAGLRGDELATVGALTLGYKEELGKELRRHFQASGAAHVLAVSGLHTGIIYGVLIGLLTLGGHVKPRYENRAGRWTISLLIISVMWFYAWLTGMTPSVVRAVLMVTIFEVGRMAYRQAISLNTIAAAAVLILLGCNSGDSNSDVGISSSRHLEVSKPQLFDRNTAYLHCCAIRDITADDVLFRADE